MYVPPCPLFFNAHLEIQSNNLIRWSCAITAHCRQDRKKTQRICVTKQNRAREEHLLRLPRAPYGLYLRYREWVHSYLKAKVIGHSFQDKRENAYFPTPVPQPYHPQTRFPNQIWLSEELVLPVLWPGQSSSEHFITRCQTEEGENAPLAVLFSLNTACFIHSPVRAAVLND